MSTTVTAWNIMQGGGPRVGALAIVSLNWEQT